MKNKIETCDAVKLIRLSDDISMESGDVETWTMLDEDLSKFDLEDIVLTITANDENYEFEYEFTKNNLLQSTVEDNTITLFDVDGNEETIQCFKTVQASLD